MSTVDKDKGKLVSTIDELDRYKRDALMKTWKSVNEWVPSMYQVMHPTD
jgi:structural maintenance of chromosome 2